MNIPIIKTYDNSWMGTLILLLPVNAFLLIINNSFILYILALFFE